jgi:serine phosphatase RsbU (regulator of sigma subunit)
MALTRAYMRSFAALDLDVGEILTRVNGMLTCDLESNRFVTMLLIRIEAGSRVMHYANAGHVPGFLLGVNPDDGLRSTLASTGPPMGMFSGSVFPSREVVLEGREVVLLVTDGVTESARADDEQFGAERLLAYVRAHSDGPAHLIAEGVCDAARGFTAGEPQVDDVTSVVVKVAQGASAAATVSDGEPETRIHPGVPLGTDPRVLSDRREQESPARAL